MGKITKIEPTVKALPKRKKVAAYARVSMETERLHHSLSAQVSYYSDLIQKNPEWEYAGVYADEGISGTSTSKRPEFQRLLSDCEAGKIDIVLTKSHQPVCPEHGRPAGDRPALKGAGHRSTIREGTHQFPFRRR
jgi:site-specific DNA recombinase